MARPSLFSKEDDLIIKENVDSFSHKEIAKMVNARYKYDKYTANQIKGRAGTKGWLRPKKHIFNRRFFERIDTKDKAYWLGFMYADGYIINTKNTCEASIQLAAKDKKHLEKFNICLNGNVPVTEFISKVTTIESTGQIIQPHPICQIRLYSIDMVKDLINLNLLQNKTYENVSPDLCYSDEINIAIIRGFFDGDGCVAKDGSCHFTAYSNVFLDKVQKFLESKGIKCTNYSENEHKQRLFINYKYIKPFLELIYEDHSYTYLDRKFILANKIIEEKKQKLMSKQSSYTTVSSVNVV